MFMLAISFFFNDTATTEIYTLSLPDALPICHPPSGPDSRPGGMRSDVLDGARPHLASGHPPSGPDSRPPLQRRSEEHTSELQSRLHLVCRLLLEKKKRDTGSRSYRLEFLLAH